MNSKMTEKEFRERIRFRVERNLDGVEVAVQAAREAGLEFAPEPVKLPEILLWQHGNWWVQVDGKPSKFLGDLSERDATLRTAADRYNAYPGLQRKAQALVDAVRDSLAPARQVYVEEEAAALEDELAKGPKP